MKVNVSDKVFKKFGKTFMEGDVVFYENEPGKTMYIIYEGEVKITKKARDIETTLAVLKKGDFFGEMSLIDNSPRSATATINKGNTKLIEVDKDIFENHITSNPKIIMQILKKMSQRIRETDKQIENLLLKDILSKIVGTLKLILKNEEKNKNGFYVLDYVKLQKDIASRLGIPLEKVMEVLQRLDNKGLVQIKNNKFIIEEERELEKYMNYLELREKYSGV
ncbi:MAG: Crp/Fnr family transcriptional regulator [Candidatus Mcinerneyibacterium aminivorans]|uniref:Crp/Fnr family transcriptional regulator n=1 Tax=Candidatus Mcinerneyibacterium aminivorans TaxID=2703815 RepID=A0A5D0ML20_9BACT|nr:MAG: Crp/Fnr family transcriptional regulator [Candidatus Mcinerneyibacterium aminivorans]